MCRLPLCGCSLVERLKSVAELDDGAIRLTSVTAIRTFQSGEESSLTRFTVKVVNVGRTQLKTKVVERLLGFDVEVNVDESNCHFLSERPKCGTGYWQRHSETGLSV